MRILVVEDDERLADVVRRGLSERGDVVDVALDGLDGEHAAKTGGYDAIVLDINLPRKDGLSLLRSLRADGSATPIVLVTSRDTPDDVVEGLDAGADDYIRKPFAFKELAARLRSAMRREAPHAPVILRVGDLSFDTAARRLTRAERVIELTARESVFVEYFMRNAGRVLTRAMIETALWDRTSETTSNVVDVYVRRLRVKLHGQNEAPVLTTVRGLGYRFGP